MRPPPRCCDSENLGFSIDCVPRSQTSALARAHSEMVGNRYAHGIYAETVLYVADTTRLVIINKARGDYTVRTLSEYYNDNGDARGRGRGRGEQ